MLRLLQHPSLRALFLAMAMVAAALGAPVKVEPPPPGRVPAELVRDEGDEGDDGAEPA
jgi:hypothetical protein